MPDRQRALIGVGVAVALLTAACASAPPEPELLRRHAYLARGEAPDLVRVTVHAGPLPPEADGTRLLQLSRSAQPELIESLAAKTRSVEDFLSALAAPAAAAPDPSDLDDRTRFRRRVVVSAESRAPGAADRIARLRVALSLDTLKGWFGTWDRYASDHGTVDVGAMALRRDAESALDLALSPAGRLAAADRGRLDVGSAVRLDEELRVSDRYLSTGILLPDSMVLLQRGALGVDLSGNSVLAVELRTRALPPIPVHGFAGLFDDRGLPAPPDAVRARVQSLRVPRPLPRGLTARLRYEATTRTVAPGAGDATYAEGDDDVRLLRTVGRESDVTLVSAAELRASVWEVVDAACRDAVHVRAPGASRASVLRLASWEDADRLARWLAATGSDHVGGYRLLLGPETAVDPARRPGLRVRLVPLNWDPGIDRSCP